MLVASDVLWVEGCTDERDGMDDSNFQIIVGELIWVRVVDVVEVTANAFDETVAIAIPGNDAIWQRYVVVTLCMIEEMQDCKKPVCFAME